MKKSKGVVRVENHDPAVRAAVDKMLDEDKAPEIISSVLVDKMAVNLEARDIREYATWRDIATAQPGTDKVPKGAETRLTPETVTLQDIFHVVKIKVVQLMEDSLKDPTSDATKIVEALLLQQMTNEAMGFKEGDLKTVVELQRRNKEMEQDHKIRLIKSSQEERRLKLQSEKYRRARRIAKEEQKTRRAGKPWNPTEAFDRISAVIGLGTGLKERVEAKALGAGENAEL